MSEVLVVKAHPFAADRSRTITVLDEFMAAYKAAHGDDHITTLDLYAVDFPELNGAILDAWGQLSHGTSFDQLAPAVQKAMGQFNDALAQFKAADKLVVANPMWNLGIPTKLKDWIDAITVVGQTFRYTADGHIALLPGKKMVHIQAAGGKYAGKDPATTYVRAALEYLGVSPIVDIPVEGMDHFPDQATAIVDAAKAKAREVAKSF